MNDMQLDIFRFLRQQAAILEADKGPCEKIEEYDPHHTSIEYADENRIRKRRETVGKANELLAKYRR